MKTMASKLHIATWTVACILTLQPLFTGQKIEAFVTTVIATLFWMVIYYFFYLYMSPVFLLPRKLVTFFTLSLSILLILPFIGYTLLLLSKAIMEGNFEDLYKVYSVQMHLSGLKAMTLAGLCGSFFRLIVEYFKKS
jgi:hypothetical protein